MHSSSLVLVNLHMILEDFFFSFNFILVRSTCTIYSLLGLENGNDTLSKQNASS